MRGSIEGTRERRVVDGVEWALLQVHDSYYTGGVAWYLLLVLANTN